ncbi:MAG: hypothetical protein IJ691_03125 [Lachnospiraceae bacterium]|nr:hypothetical protein [Lachnospiraceae bacterium]
MKKGVNVLKLLAVVLAAMIVYGGCANKGSADIVENPEITSEISGNTDDSTGESGETEENPSSAQNPDSSNAENGNGSEEGGNTGEESGNTGEEQNPEDILAAIGEQEIGIKVDFSIVNLCGADIGMISTISPYTDEQVDIGYLADGTVLKITMDWPEEVNIFDLAVYNVNGELVSTSEVDITGVTESVIITLSGEGDLEDVKAEVK